MNFIKNIYLFFEREWLLLTYKDDMKNVYQKLSDIPFSNWFEMWEDLNMLKKKPCNVMKSTLKKVRNGLFIEEKKLFGFEDSEIRDIRARCNINLDKAKFMQTGNIYYRDRAKIKQAKIDAKKESQENKNTKLGDISSMIFKATNKAYNFDKVSAFEVLTIIKEINTREVKNGRHK
jgi:hypothetical protein